ncbi:hypothetical protein M3629_10120 [Paenibacillus polysaccharolyticus]|uniref:hypothetical protein n=1 Tax=Paenibacillus polysaccharolyticus TaxID=582692 RepID=UPI00203BE1A9|nr:hypothetical protein [Paenibacillus polysaccharolyticus]MCM3133146.1 hypothetical protein [Paenibacillus polysaccharolyticus]
MFPSIGDIYCVYDKLMQQYTACQITALKETEDKKPRQLAAILQLNWSGDQLPTKTELDVMKPLICNYYFWNGTLEHNYVQAEVPASYIFVGNRPPLITEESRSYSAGWPAGESLYRQRQWELIDVRRRALFKQAANDHSEIIACGIKTRRNTSTIRNFFPTSADDVAELKALPCLTHIEMNGYHEAIIPFLKENPFVYELHAQNHGQRILNFSQTQLTRLVVDASGVEKIIPGDKINFLSLTGEISPNLLIDANAEGKRLTLSIAETVPAIRGLSRLSSLQLHKVKELDIESVVQAYPELSELRLWGNPGTVSGIQSIQHLKSLQMFSTNDLFGFDGEQFPDPEMLPELHTLWMSSLPADASKSIKARYRKVAETRIDLDITQPRKPEWLAENLNNPFRDWDGREQIKAVHAKKAAQLYKQSLKRIRELSQRNDYEDTLSDQLISFTQEYTQTFNQMDAKSQWIETIEREEIAGALEGLIDQLEEQLEINQSGSFKINREHLYEVFDQTRDF